MEEGPAAVEQNRHRGLFGATAVGVGAIVGGGILALAGVAFATTGPAAILAFALNGTIALLTAASFAELATRFPVSGGTYAYAKRVLPVEVAFTVGFVVWFASILAGVLYALGFAAFALDAAARVVPGWGEAPFAPLVALAATAAYALVLALRPGSGGQLATVGKIVVFGALIAGGLWKLSHGLPRPLGAYFSPFLPRGPLGLLEAMGYTFIALQGFDLVAAVGGEVRDPRRNLPRAMVLSLLIALLVYLPLLVLMATVGAPAEGSVLEAAEANPAGFVAESAERFLGAAGYWLVIGAGILSMASALGANLLGASRVAFAMARDRTLPRVLGTVRGASGSPAVAVGTTAGMIALLVVAVGEVAAAGAASSLIFLISFAMAHGAAVLARRRSGQPGVPWLPLLGIALCLGLALFQAFAVPEAGVVVAGWLALGGVLYLFVLAPGARLADAAAEARDPELVRLRGRSPLVLVPVANPANAASLSGVAATVATPGVGRILLLSVLPRPERVPDEGDPLFADSQAILAEALLRSFERGTAPEVLFAIAEDPWREVVRVAHLHRCETVLLGAPRELDTSAEERLARVLSELRADAAVLRAPRRWRIAGARRVLLPIGGRRDHSRLRARLLASLGRGGQCEVTYLLVLPPGTTADARRRAEWEVRRLARDEAEASFRVVVEISGAVVPVVLRHARDMDLVVLGMRTRGAAGHALGDLALAILRESPVPVIALGSRGGRSPGWTTRAGAPGGSGPGHPPRGPRPRPRRARPG